MEKLKEIELLENKVKNLELEVIMMKKIVGIKMGKKDPNAWKKLQEVGKKISKYWRINKPSWQVISEVRR
jgi:hypothetical protein